jgi:decaprenyl-phosphate phosphoribosyltransferase
LAAGVVTISQAFIIITVLFIAGTTLMTSVSFTAMNILLIYFKHMAILDVPIIAIGFALRIFLGSAVTDTPPSMCIVIMTFLLALFMALAKRRDDVLIYLETGEKMRKVVDGYNLQSLDAAMAIMAPESFSATTITQHLQE